MRILVVDDETDVQFLFDQRFRRERRSGELQLDYAHSGEEALQLLERQGTADLVLILSDINMPGMSGLELLRSLKETNPQLRVFMVTAYGDDNTYRKAIELGADGYLTKPLNFDELKEKFAEFVS